MSYKAAPDAVARKKQSKLSLLLVSPLTVCNEFSASILFVCDLTGFGLPMFASHAKHVETAIMATAIDVGEMMLRLFVLYLLLSVELCVMEMRVYIGIVPCASCAAMADCIG